VERGCGKGERERRGERQVEGDVAMRKETASRNPDEESRLGIQR